MESQAQSGALSSEGPAEEVVAAIAQAGTITADEIALYDRQIRLWGVKAQEKIRNANILLINITALANEIAKNLVLAGIGSLTIIDDQIVSADDLASQFFLREKDVGKSRAISASREIQKLNPRVKVTADTDEIFFKLDDYYAPFDMVIACDLEFNTLSAVNAATNIAKKPLYASGAHGFYGYIFADLVSHEYVIEREKSNVPTILKAESVTRSIIGVSTKVENGKKIELVTKREMYSPFLLAKSSPLAPEIRNNRRRLRQVTPLLTCIRALWDFERVTRRQPTHKQADLEHFTILAHECHKDLKLPIETLTSQFLRSFLQNIGSELAPVTAFLGGQVAQDVINVLGKREQPIQNMMLFDGENSSAPVYVLHPVFDDMGMTMTLPIIPIPQSADVIE